MPATQNAPLSLIAIDTPEDPRLEAYCNIKEKDLIRNHQRFIAEGKVVLHVLLQSKRFRPSSILVLDNKLDGVMPLLETYAPTCPIYHAPQMVIDAVAGFHLHRGILAIGERISPLSFDDFLEQMPKNALLPVLCGISNHDNMGAIFRNSAAFAADGIVLDQSCCDPLYRKAIRVSVGAALKLPYAVAPSIDSLLQKLYEHKFEIFAFSPSASTSLYEVKAATRTALLFGTEGEGLPKTLLQRLKTLRIPMARDFDSLNVATATGIALSHFADKTKF